MKLKRQQAPEWIFPWRRTGEPLFPKVLAVAAVTIFFALLLGTLRIRLETVSPWAPRRASMIQVGEGAEGRTLTLRAREGGPFPSRFDPADWPPFASLERAVLDAARPPLAPYAPGLRELPARPPAVPALAEPGRVVLPPPPAAGEPVKAQPKPALVPALRALSGIAQDAIPDHLPAYQGPVGPALTADAQRFLLRLDSTGTVIDSMALGGGEDGGTKALESWLRGVTFPADARAAQRWIAVAVGFINHAPDGTEPR